MEKLYVEKFSKRELDHYDHMYALSDDETGSQESTHNMNGAPAESTEHEGSEQRPVDVVENLKAELEHMKLGDDECEDWEDLFDEE